MTFPIGREPSLSRAAAGRTEPLARGREDEAAEAVSALVPPARSQIVDNASNAGVGSDHQLSGIAGGVNKRQVLRDDQQTEYSKRWAARALATCAAIPMGGRNTKWGNRWRRASPWLSTALTVTGAALCATGVGAAIGGPLLATGIGIGIAGRMQAMADTTVQFVQDKEAGRDPSAWKLAAKLAANTVALGLLAVPVAGHFAHALPGTVGHWLEAGTKLADKSAHLPTAAWQEIGVAAGPAVAGMGAIAASFKGRPASARDVVQVEGEFTYHDPLNGGQPTGLSAGDFVKKMQPVANARLFADPAFFRDRDTQIRHQFSQLFDHMRESQQCSAGFIGVVEELCDDDDDGSVPPGEVNFPSTSSGLDSLKQRIWDDAERQLYKEYGLAKRTYETDNSGPEPQPPSPRRILQEYQRQLRLTKDVVQRERNSLARDYGEVYDSAKDLYERLPDKYKHADESGTKIAYDGALVNRQLGNRSALIVDGSGRLANDGKSLIFHTFAGMGAVLPEEQDAGMHLTQQKRGMNAHLSASDRADYEDAANLTGDLKSTVASVFDHDSCHFVVSGTSQGGGKGAYAGAANDTATFVTDPQDLSSRTIDGLVKGRGINYREQWDRNLVVVTSEGEKLQAERLGRGFLNTVSYNRAYVLNAPPDRHMPMVQSSFPGPLHGMADQLLRQGTYYDRRADDDTGKDKIVMRSIDNDDDEIDVTALYQKGRSAGRSVPVDWTGWNDNSVMYLSEEMRADIDECCNLRAKPDGFATSGLGFRLPASTSASVASRSLIQTRPADPEAERIAQHGKDQAKKLVEQQLGLDKNDDRYVRNRSLRLALINSLSYLSDRKFGAEDANLRYQDFDGLTKFVQDNRDRLSSSSASECRRLAVQLNKHTNQLREKGWQGLNVTNVAQDIAGAAKARHSAAAFEGYQRTGDVSKLQEIWFGDDDSETSDSDEVASPSKQVPGPELQKQRDVVEEEEENVQGGRKS